MHMDTPDNYYAILGVPPDADNDTLKRAYRQLARRYHPDLAGPDGTIQMKRINRAYDVLSDPEKRLNYDTIIGGSIDLRKGGLTRPRTVARKFRPEEEIEFAGLSIFSSRGPLHTGERLQSGLAVVTTLLSAKTTYSPLCNRSPVCSGPLVLKMLSPANSISSSGLNLRATVRGRVSPPLRRSMLPPMIVS